MAPAPWVGIEMPMPWYLLLAFTGIAGQEQDNLAISNRK